MALAAASFAATVSINVNNASFTNVLAGFNNPVTVTAVQLSSTGTGTNASIWLIDTPTNSLTYSNSAYTTTISYATNYISTWTNFYGVTQSWTNISLVDVSFTNAASTNAYPVRAILSAAAGSVVTYNNLNANFYNGLWATNLSTATNTLIVTYK